MWVVLIPKKLSKEVRIDERGSLEKRRTIRELIQIIGRWADEAKCKMSLQLLFPITQEVKSWQAGRQPGRLCWNFEEKEGVNSHPSEWVSNLTGK